MENLITNAARPKASFIMWWSLQSKLMTMDRLITWGIKADPMCYLCKDDNETQNHTTVECVVIKEVWTKLLKWMDKKAMMTPAWDQHI